MKQPLRIPLPVIPDDVWDMMVEKKLSKMNKGIGVFGCGRTLICLVQEKQAEINRLNKQIENITKTYPST